MADLITEAVAARLRAVGAQAVPEDLYAAAGSTFYERLVGSDRAEIREVLALARKTEGPILDLAAGSGRLTIPLVRSGRRVIALDLSADMLALVRHVLPGESAVECVVADMRDFTLARRFRLVILGATSLTLLNGEDRAALYAAVRRHLAPGGLFAFTLAGAIAEAELRVTRTEKIWVPGPDGAERYLFSQQIEDDGSARLVNWLRADDLVPGGRVTVFTSRLQVLGLDEICREIADAGFEEPNVSPVRSPQGAEIVMMTTSAVSSTTIAADDAVA